MKNIISFLCIILTFGSCTKEADMSHIVAQAKLMKDDPVSIEYFNTLSSFARLLREEDINLKAYHQKLKKYNVHPCKVNKEFFDGDIVMENYAVADCNLRTANKIFKQKYPSIKQLSKEERLALFRQLLPRPKLNKAKTTKRILKKIWRKINELDSHKN